MKNIFKLNNVKFFVAAIAFCGASLLGYNAYSNATMTDQERLFQQNLEALTDGEELEGKVCFYKGTTKYADYIPCTAVFPNIGPCGTRVTAFYSDDFAQCYN